ncbi:Iqg1p [Rhodotorula paludigena]|uniref:Iqg1p n=1 Tax=Rhodotorula paludigena TaxID=86838 RepID=UPI0031821CE1
MYSSPDLDRSPSLSSNSSGASSAGTQPPKTPALSTVSTFSSSTSPFKEAISEFDTPGKAVFPRLSPQKTPTSAAKTSPWSAGHRASQSFDAARQTFANLERTASMSGGASPVSRSTPFGDASNFRAGSPVRSDGASSPTRPGSPVRFGTPGSPTRGIGTGVGPPSSPTRFGSTSRATRPPLPTIPSDRPSDSPSFRSTTLSTSASARALSSAIFSTRDPAAQGAASPSLPQAPLTGLERSVVGSVRRFEKGHRRAMTLPQLGVNGLPSPDAGGQVDGAANGVGALSIEEDVPGLPGRARLSRPADSASPFAPSAVFHSSHGGLSRMANGQVAAPPKRSMTTTTLLPSQAVKAIDRQRHDLVAYEYLCHLAEAREWLEANISTRADPSVPLWGESITDFELSLRNGYALAHLARSLGGPACQGPIYADPERHFRHTVNINIFFQLVNEVGLPETFRFETVDLYDAKNLPKVIYCLHALSQLMARRGLTSRMNDLVGQIDFTDDEVGAAQKGLSASGVRMPNFRGIGKALDRHEPSTVEEEPPETDAERQARELADAEDAVVALQAQARGAIARRVAQKEMQRVRAEERRKRAEEEEARRRAEEEELRQREEEARRLREEEEAAERRRREEAAEAERRRVAEEEERRRQLEEEARLAAEEEERQYQAAVQEAARTLVGFQAVARGALERRRFFAPIEALSQLRPAVIGFQAAARGALARRQLGLKVRDLREIEPALVGFQAACRGALARQHLLGRIHQLRSTEDFIVGVQAHIRGQLARQSFAGKSRDLRKTEVVRSVGGLQSLARAALARRRVQTQRQELGFVEPDVVGIQAQVRGYLGRNAFLDWQDNVYRNEGVVVFLQSILRGAMARKRYWDLRHQLHENTSRVVRLQAAIRSRRQGSQYRQLRVGTNVPVSTIKNFMRLLDDSEFDYRGELQVESLRKELVGAIREAQKLEDDVKDLDTKIALLVKNKITHEVARAQRSGQGALAPLKRTSLLSAANDPFAGGALDHQTQRKLDLYQQLFWHLQTKPDYLARLFANTARLGISERTQKQIEATTFVVFGYGQGHREEYLLLKLFQRSVQEEFAALPNVAAFLHGKFTFLRLLMQYGRGVQQRQYLVTSLSREVNAVMGRQGLDLGTDPIAIYRNEISKEEMHTGLPSQRPKDVNDYAHALADRATNKVFIEHLLALIKATRAFLTAIVNSTAQMPYGVRFVAREIFRALRARFPEETEENIVRIAGHVVYYRFLQPAICAPETYGIVEGVVPPIQRQNLGEVCKMLNQISVGRKFGGAEQKYLEPLNDFIAESTQVFTQWILEVLHVEDPETYFRADQYVDAAASRQPVIYISPNDIYAMHSIIAETIDLIAPEEHDPVRVIVTELGGVPAGGSSDLGRARADDVALTLATRVLPQEDPEAGAKHLFNQAKRRVLAILKVHHGNDLEAVLAQQVTPEDEDLWLHIVEEEEAEERRQAHEQRRAVVPQLDDIRNMTFHQLKMATLGDIVQLRQIGLVSKADKYQAILNAIAHDIRSKHHRRVQRQNELQTMHATLTSVHDKRRYLADQIKSYHEYIDQSMAGIQKKSKKRIVLPWSMQGQHQRRLEKEGKRYQFGSYQYSAQELYNRGILLSIDQYSPKQFDKVRLAISSDGVGVFEIKASFMGMAIETVEVKLEDLLEAQFVGKQTVSIGDVAKCSLSLLLNLINRKFYQ